MANEETGFELWGGESLKLPDMESKRCSVCGEPALIAIRKLSETERTFLCSMHATFAAPPMS